MQQVLGVWNQMDKAHDCRFENKTEQTSFQSALDLVKSQESENEILRRNAFKNFWLKLCMSAERASLPIDKTLNDTWELHHPQLCDKTTLKMIENKVINEQSEHWDNHCCSIQNTMTYTTCTNDLYNTTCIQLLCSLSLLLTTILLSYFAYSNPASSYDWFLNNYSGRRFIVQRLRRPLRKYLNDNGQFHFQKVER